MKTRTFGVDLAKRAFQVHSVDMETGEVERRQLKREALVRFFAKQAPAVIAMEACGSAHYWARRFASLGHRFPILRDIPVEKIQKIESGSFHVYRTGNFAIGDTRIAAIGVRTLCIAQRTSCLG
ncbi:transposase [Paraburkholderia sp. UYCP14C]|uniref:transposase n=1 Tax=Paraburkholderia sp. UYCP14C TaxID=2511130 RepID=UPI001022727A|nr:transposase [Paraburkholderia sp. UYCP14C]